jgi:hypothetical protein
MGDKDKSSKQAGSHSTVQGIVKVGVGDARTVLAELRDWKLDPANIDPKIADYLAWLTSEKQWLSPKPTH